MKACFRHNKKSGFSFIEVLVAAALLTLIFSGLMASVQLMTEFIGKSKAEAGARSLAVSKLEYIRSLDYDVIGTIAGIPSGPIPQVSTTTLNDIDYTERILIQYVDREADGFGAADENGITEDSKRIKIEYTWNLRGEVDSLILVSDVIPPGIESTSGGGTLFINVFDASILPVVGATVHVVNNSVATDTIDVTVSTNAAGIANFPGAPARSGYQITVTKDGYSTDQTYSASSTNPNPNPPHVAVAAGAVTTMYFSIDEVSDLTLRTISTPVKGVYSDSFTDATGLVAQSGISVTGGEIILAGTPGSYQPLGTVMSVTHEPVTISFWEALDFTAATTTNSAFKAQLYSVEIVGSSSIYTLIPDTDLPGNSAGFTKAPVNLTGLDATTYSKVAIGATLTSTNPSQTPRLSDWSITHVESEPPVSGVDFTVSGQKVIGENAGQPVLKYTNTVTTDGDGEVVLFDLEWDAYQILINGSVEGYDIAETYAPMPFALAPGITEVLTIVLAPHSAYSLRATVYDTLNNIIPGALVRLYRTGYNETIETSIYGQSFFDALTSATDYTLEVTVPGFTTNTQTNVTVNGNMQLDVVMGHGSTATSTPPPPPPPPPSNYLAGYDYRVPLTISGSSLFGNVTDFPVYVNLANLPATFFTMLQSDGDDIRITAANGQTQLPFELVNINTTARTGQLYFKAPSLSISTSTKFYIYFASSTATAYLPTATYGRNNVWSNSYLSVLHLEESQAGSNHPDLYKDATGNGYDGDDNVDATGKTGKLGSGQQFNESFNDNVAFPSSLLNGRTNLTLTFWYHTNTNDYMSVLSGARSSEDNEYLLWFKDRNEIEFFSHGEPRVTFDTININDDVWRHYTSVRDDTNNQTRFYLNGAEDNQSPTTDSMTALTISNGGVFIGVDQDSVGGSFDQGLDGELDEFRLSSVVRSSGWIANEYANQNSPTSFYSVGSVENE